jgi:type II secretory pathway component PulF
MARPLTTPAYPSTTTLRERVSHALEAHFLRQWSTARARIALLHQMRSLLRVGLGLPETLASLAGEGRSAESRRLREALRLVENGSTLAHALRDSKTLDAVSSELLAAAQESGTIDQALALLIEQEERFRRIRRDTMLPGLYPAFLFSAVVFLGPLFSLPARVAHGMDPSRMPFAYAIGLMLNLALIVIAGLALFGAPVLAAAANAESWFEALLDHFPIVGRVRRDLASARFLATLERVRRGGTLSDAVAQTGVLTEDARRSLRVGEMAGQIDSVCKRLADEALDRATQSSRLAASASVYLAYALLLGVVAFQILSFASSASWPYNPRFMDGF